MYHLFHQVLHLGVSLRAPGTIRTYNHHWQAFARFCANHSLPELPASDLTASLFLMDLVNRHVSYGVIESACSAITFAHRLADAPSPCHGPWTSRVREHAKRTCTRPSRARDPISLPDIHRASAPFLASGDVREFQKGVILLLMYAAFLRFSDLISLQWQDIQFDEGNTMWLFIPNSKTDPFGQGAHSPMVATGGTFCPVLRTLDLLLLGNFRMDTPGPLIRTYRGASRSPSTTAPTYATICAWCLDAFSRAGLDCSTLVTHSLRRSAATVAANSCVSDLAFRSMGRWRSDQSRDGYVTLLDPLLTEVSRSIHSPVALSQAESHARTLAQRRSVW